MALFPCGHTWSLTGRRCVEYQLLSWRRGNGCLHKWIARVMHTGFDWWVECACLVEHVMVCFWWYLKVVYTWFKGVAHVGMQARERVPNHSMKGAKACLEFESNPRAVLFLRKIRPYCWALGSARYLLSFFQVFFLKKIYIKIIFFYF
jgi:hypothetical protein